MTKLVTFASLKGGVGKTTHAVALTAGLLDIGKTVRFIETDEQGSAGAWADELAATHENLDSVYVPVKDGDFAAIQDAIAKHADGPEFAIVDTGGSANAGTLASLYLSDLVLVPFALREWDMDGLHRIRRAYDQMFERFQEDNPQAMVALYRPGVSFISAAEREQLETLSKDYVIRRGLTDTPTLPKWIATCRTPAQLRDGEDPVSTSVPLTAKNLQTAEGHIVALTQVVMEMFDGA